MAASKLDSIYRRMLKTRFFEKGWGDPVQLERFLNFRKIISNRETCLQLIPHDYEVKISKSCDFPDYVSLQGSFITPLELYMPGMVPPESQRACFEMVLPKKWEHANASKPVCIHLAGTGDHYYWRRREMVARPLMREANLGAILIENPYYGLRKPKAQVRSNLHYVSDIFVIGGCLILECLVLLHWCERNGFGPLGITGLSMGGHNASLAATNWPKPLVVVPCLSWSTASTVFTEGVLSHSINWDLLQSQYFKDPVLRSNIRQMVNIVNMDSAASFQHFTNEPQTPRLHNLKQCSKQVYSNICSTFENFSVNFINNNSKRKLLKQMSPAAFKNISSPLWNLLHHLRIEDANTLGSIRNILMKTKRNFNNIPGPLYSLFKDLRSVEQQNLFNNLWNMMVRNRNCLHPNRIDVSKINWWDSETLMFMKALMDECTHLGNYSVPFDTSLSIAICALNDSYVPRAGCSSLEDLWPGMEVHYVQGGHVSSYVCHQKLYRACIAKAFAKAQALYQQHDFKSKDQPQPTFDYKHLLELYEKNSKLNRR